MAPNPPLQGLIAWVRERAHLMLTAAPKRRPDLLFGVLVLGVVVLALYALAFTLHG